jgi:hypothetical protein
MTKAAFALALVTTCAWAAPEDFPLEVGNSWIYRVTEGRISRPRTVEVQAQEIIEDRTYYRVSFFDTLVYLRYDDNGSLVQFDRDLKQERIWIPLGAPVGEAADASIDSCSKFARVESRNAGVKTELGEFNTAVHLTYTPSCADAGVVQQYFLPYVGLILHETTSFAGPVRYELVYSRTGVTNIDVRTNALTLATDAPSYQAGEDAKMLARVTLRVTEPITLVFPSGQSTDLRIKNEDGDIVYTWSADKLFPQIYREEQIGPGERSWPMEVPLGQLQPGRYQAEGWLTTESKRYSAVVTFDIVR